MQIKNEIGFADYSAIVCSVSGRESEPTTGRRWLISTCFTIVQASGKALADDFLA